MKQIYFTFLFLVFGFTVKAQQTLNERVFVHTDKECYVAGEEMLIKIFATDSRLQPSSFSKVGYVEICGQDRPQVQLKLVLQDGSGSGKLTIPLTTPSGIYELSGYTRYMRNEREDMAFKKQIAIVNLAQPSENDRIELLDEDAAMAMPSPKASNIRVATDKKQYGNRSKVTLSLESVPANAIDLVVSVVRNDSITSFPQVDASEWIKQATQASAITDWKWQPEYEGHIITGKPVSTPQAGKNFTYTSGIGFIGADIHYINGKQEKDGTTSYYTNGVYGPQDVVTSSVSYDNSPYQIDIQSPFAESLPQSLPSLQLRAKDPQLMDRFVAVQLKQVMGVDSLGRNVPLNEYYYFSKPIVYDLDEYTRFNTIRETIIEFVMQLAVRRSNSKPYIRVQIPGEKGFSTGNTLLLLDGAPIRDHEHMLSYNPRNIRYIQIYNGKYIFGGENFDCMVSFVSHRKDLSHIQLDAGSQLITYDCPSLPEPFAAPEYPDATARQSIKPDFRHTLYWNPNAEKLPQPAELSFYTSDLSGEFKVTVEGFTQDGKALHGSATFRVEN
ncbi:hypothetical protein [uncultured Alistipes sp.]|jgi:conserved hypothetical protein|uniref:hypothetical protein n=1 Tax=uncultured Alistipes sp. TaxID=538949 RepID=UPI0025EDD32B|nr:hypothetical protein [uncultured Alistipes sp.]